MEDYVVNALFIKNNTHTFSYTSACSCVYTFIYEMVHGTQKPIHPTYDGKAELVLKQWTNIVQKHNITCIIWYMYTIQRLTLT